MSIDNSTDANKTMPSSSSDIKKTETHFLNCLGDVKNESLRLINIRNQMMAYSYILKIEKKILNTNVISKTV